MAWHLVSVSTTALFCLLLPFPDQLNSNPTGSDQFSPPRRPHPIPSLSSSNDPPVSPAGERRPRPRRAAAVILPPPPTAGCTSAPCHRWTPRPIRSLSPPPPRSPPSRLPQAPGPAPRGRRGATPRPSGRTTPPPPQAGARESTSRAVLRLPPSPSRRVLFPLAPGAPLATPPLCSGVAWCPGRRR